MNTHKATTAREFRSVTRAIASTDGNKVRGYFAKFGTFSQDLGGFVETLSAGCFTDSLRDNPDVMALADHDSSKVLARVSSGTLRVWEDRTGLAFDLTLPNTSYANDLKESLARRDITGCSFGFCVNDDEWSSRSDGSVLRTIKKATVFEGSIVSAPAYLDTEASLRQAFPDGRKHLRLANRDSKADTALLLNLLYRRAQQ